MFEFILFLCGMSVMILELAGVRILCPFLGATHIVYTSIIGIIMASLSLGYWFGGKLSSRNVNCTKLAFIILGSAIYILCLAIFQFKFLNCWSEKVPIITQAVADSIFMFCIPSILLGIVTPYVVELVSQTNNDRNSTGNMVGRLYAISTIGSIFGTFFCGFYLITTFGIDRIFISLSFLLFLTSFLCFTLDIQKKNIINFIFIFTNFTLVLFTLFLLLKPEKFPIQVFKNSIYSKTTLYNYINLKTDIDKKRNDEPVIKSCNKKYCQSASYINLPPDEFVFGYISVFNNIFKIKSKKNDILLLGNATGSNLAGILHFIEQKKLQNIKIDVVEIDKEYTTVGEKYFNLQKNDKRVKYFYEDARTFLNRNNDQYDIIYFDIYTESFVFPNYLITTEAIQHIANALNENGILVMNIIGSAKYGTNPNLYMNQIYTQIKHEIPYVKIIIPNDSKPNAIRNNYVLIASKSQNEPEIIKNKLTNKEYKKMKLTSEIYTDKYSPIEKFSL